jgi:hypothetical protein
MLWIVFSMFSLLIGPSGIGSVATPGTDSGYVITDEGGTGIPPHAAEGGTGIPPHALEGGTGIPPHRI